MTDNVQETNTETQTAVTERTYDERTVSPRANIYEDADAVTVELEMPGVSRADVQVTVENDELTVYGERRVETDEGLEVLHRERLPYSYKRTFLISDRIDSGKISASCESGLLKLTLPKAAELKPRNIPVN